MGPHNEGPKTMGPQASQPDAPSAVNAPTVIGILWVGNMAQCDDLGLPKGSTCSSLLGSISLYNDH